MTCPHCDRGFDVDVDPMQLRTPTHSFSTHRGMAPATATIRENAPTCAACGLVRSLHEGGEEGDSLAWARYGCDAFVERT